MSKEYPQFQLMEHILNVASITCDFCNERKRMECMESDEAMDVWYEDGWRARKKCYCPKCAKKKLKNSK